MSTADEEPTPVAEPEQPIKKRKTQHRKEGQLIPSDEGTSESTSDETWTPPSSEDDDSGAEAVVLPCTRQLRSSGPVPRPVAEEVNPIMDKVDEEIDNESDFSSTTEEEDEDEEEEDSSVDDEEEDESDTEEDGYSDDDSFVTSNEDEDEEDDDDDEDDTSAVTVPVPDPNETIIGDPITTDELLANFGPADEPTGPAC